MVIIPSGLRIVNKTVVYSDTVLSTKDLGKNLKITVINNIKKDDFDKCLNIIFNDNKDVIFNTIQYSRKEKKIYLYTNKKIDTKRWEERDITEYEYENYDTKILEEIKKELKKEDSLKLNIISLYDIFKIYKKKYKKYDNREKTIEDNIREKTDEIIIGYELLGIYHSFLNDEIRVILYNVYDYSKLKYTFKRKDNDVYISKINRMYGKQKLLSSIGDDIKDLFELKDKQNNWLKRSSKYRINNSSKIFRVDIKGYSVELTLMGSPTLNIELTLHSRKCKINCNSNNILSCIKGNEEEIFKRIFVDIEDCPDCVKDELYEYRYKKLKEVYKKRIEEEQKPKTLRYKIKTIISRNRR